MNTEDIVIVGGGPVGLFLGICLHHLNIPCTILESRTEPINETRSLGIHPASLELFEKTGTIDAFLESGLKVYRGIAHTGRSVIGDITFEDCPPPYKFILISPQYQTEGILRDHFNTIAPGSLISGADVTHVANDDPEATVTFIKDGETHQIAAAYVIGCDGKNSIVRQSAEIPFKGKRYPDTYIMGDFEDNTEYKNDAVVYLPKEGLVECFPVPGKLRRWVVKTNEYVPEPTAELISDVVFERTGHRIPPSTNTMVSGFGVQHFLAETFDKKRVLLAGDAAHVVSPIGGQGMNLGWQDAWYLANVLSYCGRPNLDSPLSDFFAYTSKQKPMAKKIARRAEFNMSMGRKGFLHPFKKSMVKLMLNTGLRRKTARLFTMRDLESWFF